MPRQNPTGARERILDAADRLFYRDGLRAAGIDTVIAEAGVAKMSLYTHFRSKDELIAAYLRRKDENIRAWFETAIRRHLAVTGDVLAAIFAALKEWFGSPDFRGCAFINAAAELPDPAHPGRQVVLEHKARFTALLAEALRDAHTPDPDAAAETLALVIDGAIVAAARDGSPDSADAAFALARRLLTRP